MRRRKSAAIGLVFLLLLGGAVYVLGWSTILSVKKIEILGTTRVDVIQKTFDQGSIHLDVGKPLARVNVRVLNRTLSNISWVASEKVQRNWRTGVVKIEVAERRPIAFFSSGTGSRTYLDESGTQFSTPELLQNLPQITLASNDDQSKQSVAHLLAAMPADFIVGLQGVRVSASAYIEMKVALTGRALTVRWGNDQDIATKIKVFRALFALAENNKATIFDLSSPIAPITK